MVEARGREVERGGAAAGAGGGRGERRKRDGRRGKRWRGDQTQTTDDYISSNLLGLLRAPARTAHSTERVYLCIPGRPQDLITRRPSS